MRQISIFLALVLLTMAHGTMAQGPIASPNTKGDSSQSLSAADKCAVTEAIVDEIYAEHLQGYVADVGKNMSGSVYQLNVYFKPTLNDRTGWVIYKLMPYGQVLRMFSMRSNGLAVLYGKLQDHFPPTQPSYLTVYMDDDQLCKYEEEWSKEHFDVTLKPGTDRVAEALTRQRRRNSP